MLPAPSLRAVMTPEQVTVPADEQVGAYSTWFDLLATHEVAHIIHLLRPSRNPGERLVERLAVPLGPITVNGPRWVLEGYATVIEGRVTGAGRPPIRRRRTWK